MEWTSRRTKASSRTSARLWDNPSVINTLTERKYTYTCAQKYEHLGSLSLWPRFRHRRIVGDIIVSLSSASSYVHVLAMCTRLFPGLAEF